MGLFDFLFTKPQIRCDRCGVTIRGEPHDHKGYDYCEGCKSDYERALELQRKAEEEALERITSRRYTPPPSAEL